MFRYSSVIVTYNRKEKLVQALKYLLNQTIKPIHIFLIDNHSTDGTKDFLKSNGLLEDTVIDYQYLDKNYGGSGGFYYGVKRALEFDDYDFLSLSDDDAMYSQNYFELIADASQNNPNVLAFTGTVMTNNVIQTDHRRLVTEPRWIREEDIPINQYDDNFYLDEASFVGLVISRKIIQKIGFPDKDYFIYYDDTDYSLRIRRFTKILNVSQAVINHETKPVKNVKGMTWKHYYGIRNFILTKKKHSDWPLLTPYLYYRYVRHVIRILFLSNYKGYRKQMLYVYQKGFNDGLAGKEGLSPNFKPGQKIPR